MSTAEIEKQSLEAHVELCAERYANLDTRLDNLEKKVDKLDEHISDIRDKLTAFNAGNYKQIIVIGTSIIGALGAAVVALIIQLVS